MTGVNFVSKLILTRFLEINNLQTVCVMFEHYTPACRLIGDSEMMSEGLRWGNIADDDLGISFQAVLLVLLVDVVILTCLAIYLDATSNSEYF